MNLDGRMTVYLDNNATTRCAPEVLETMLPFWHCDGNAAAIHRHGRLMRGAIDTAREQVAALVNAHPSEILFTSGGTEANNMAIKGCIWSKPEPGHLLVGNIEHDCVLKSAQSLSRFGWQCHTFPVGASGEYLAADFASLVAKHQPALVSMMLANNETGVIQPVAALAASAKQSHAVTHTDAVQALGKIPVDFEALGVDMMSVSAHKLGGPIGVGALVKKAHVTLESLLHGGSHQQGYRAGTENTALIAGFGKICELAKLRLADRQAHLAKMQQIIEQGIKKIPGATVIGEQSLRIPNTTLMTLAGTDGEMSLMLLDKKGFSVSSGSACGQLSVGGSHVLAAMGIEPALASTAIRISTGMSTTSEDCQRFVEALTALQQTQTQNSWMTQQ